MKVAILSRKPSLFATERLRAAGQARGHEVQVIDYLRCYMNISPVRPTILYRGQALPEFDAVIPRIGASHTVYGTAVVRQFEILGVATANGSDAIARAHDKLRSLQLLAAEGIGLPSTGFAHSSRDLAGLLAGIGDAPVVVKLLNGMPGTGAILAETNAAAASVIEAFSGLDAESLVQEFVAEAAGSSLRCLVVGKRVVAAMRRSARPGEFRSNLHRGGDALRVRLSRAERAAAVRAAAALGLDVAGVDMLVSRRGPLVMAVNASPELEHIERATGVDVAGKIYEHLERQLAGPEKKPASAAGGSTAPALAIAPPEVTVATACAVAPTELNAPAQTVAPALSTATTLAAAAAAPAATVSSTTVSSATVPSPALRPAATSVPAPAGLGRSAKRALVVASV
ncbi:MAG TPA: 30S ribosomal protein S6--L-glutamate ligase [Pirellulales bacterium]|nr:30S ribosomal protein S6--L-glutamate ligase [Pirellulales bacterium]